MKIFKLLIVIILLALIGAGGFGVYSYQNNLKPASNESSVVAFSVVEGDSVNSVLTRLEDEGIIKSAFFTKVYAKIKGIDNIQINEYELDPSFTTQKILEIISSGDFTYLQKESMTIPEGIGVEEIAEIFAEKLEMSKEDVLAQMNDPALINELIAQYPMLTEEILQPGIRYALEGYLYPETYSLVNIEKSVKSYVCLLLDSMQNIVNNYQAGIDARGMSVHQFLSFTSVVERESLFDEDRPLIAGVFYNRIAAGMTMSSDITVLYAIKEQRVNVYYEDLEVDSPYNTYKYTGTPIGPISNVSEVTINACINPTPSPYFYFFACEDGHVLYSETFEEHDRKANENRWY